MSYFLGHYKHDQQNDRPMLENAGRAARLGKWWRRTCTAVWNNHSKFDLSKLRELAFEVATDPRSLAQAFSHLRRHGGPATGPDGATYADLAACGIWHVCRSVSQELRAGRYQIAPPRLVEIEKRDGGIRYISVYDIVDRMVSRAVTATLMPLLAPGLSSSAFGGLPVRGPAAAFAQAFRELSAAERPYWVTADIRKAFDTIPRARLLNLFARFPKPMVNLLAQLAHTHRRNGIGQGLSTSPLLMHVYLHHFIDRPFAGKFPQTPLIRYMDDHLVLCRSRRVADLAHQHLDWLVRDAGLMLKPGATITDIRTESAKWLGLEIRQGSHYLLDATIAESSWEQLADRLCRCQIEGRGAVDLVRGWLGYYSLAYRPAAKRDVLCRIGRLCEAFGYQRPPTTELREHWRSAWLGLVEAAGRRVLRPQS